MRVLAEPRRGLSFGYGGREKARGRWDGLAGGLQSAAECCRSGVSLHALSHTHTRSLTVSLWAYSLPLTPTQTYRTGRWRPRFSSQPGISILGKEGARSHALLGRPFLHYNTNNRLRRACLVVYFPSTASRSIANHWSHTYTYTHTQQATGSSDQDAACDIDCLTIIRSWCIAG